MPLFDTICTALYASWVAGGPVHMDRVVLLHPDDRETLARELQAHRRHWGYPIPHRGPFRMETDLGDVTVQVDQTVAPGDIRTLAAAEAEHLANVEG